MTWDRPMVLLLLVLIVPIWWRWLRRKPHSAVRFSSTAWLGRQSAGLRVKMRHIVPLLRTLAVVLLVESFPVLGEESGLVLVVELNLYSK